MSTSVSEFILATDLRRLSGSRAAASRASISFSTRSRSEVGAIASCFSRGGSEYPVNALKNADASVPKHGRRRQEPHVRVHPGGLVVVVAGPEMQIAAQPVVVRRTTRQIFACTL